MKIGNRMPVTLLPLSETQFFAKETETEMTFLKNENGQELTKHSAQGESANPIHKLTIVSG